MEKKKMGRPTDNPKSNRIHLRIDDSTLKLLDECTEKLETTRTSVIVKGIELVKKELEKQ